MARTLALVVAALAVILALAWSLQRRLVYFPGGAPPPVGEVLPAAEAVTFATADGLTLDAWFLPAGPTAVIVFPGNAGNRAARAPLAQALADHGFSVLLVDYRGYGGNPGDPTEEGLRRDARAALEWVDARDEVEALVYFGESLGSGVATWLATQAPPEALVLRSPIPSLGAVARVHYGPVPDFLLRDRFDVVEHIATVDVPTLVVIGEADDIVPPDLSRRVAAAAGGATEVVTIPGAGHNSPALLDGERFVSAVVGFLEQYVRRR